MDVGPETCGHFISAVWIQKDNVSVINKCNNTGIHSFQCLYDAIKTLCVIQIINKPFVGREKLYQYN